MRTFLLGLLILVAANLEAQRTLHIPTDSRTIQAGIDAAQPGDTVLVAAGTWLENLDFHGKAITVQSAEGPALTILDGGRLAPTVSFTTGETRASILIGFTIRNGAPAAPAPGQLTSHGAGALLNASSPTLKGNLFTENLCAALDATASAPLLQDNSFTRTQTDPGCLGQAIAPITLTGSPTDSTLLPTLLHNTVEDNNLTGSSIEPNAGAIALLGARAVLQSNIVRNNTVAGDAPTIQIVTNPTTVLPNPILVQENLLYGNVSQCGAALLVSVLNDDNASSAPHLEVELLGNTLADDALAPACPAATAASELTLAAGTLPQQLLVANNIFAASSSYPALACASALPPDLFHHNLLHNTAGPALSPICPESGANLLADPLFVDRPARDYHLNLHSAAVDAGSNVAPRPMHDLDNAARLQNATARPTAIVDLGAFEYPAPRDAMPASTTVVNLTPFPGQAFQKTTLTSQVTTAAGISPTGSVTFTAGTRTLAVVPLDAAASASFTTTSLPAGTWNIVATYSGSATLEPSASATLAETVAPAVTQLAFDVSPSTAAVSQPVVLSARVSASLSSHTPEGSVQFFDLPATGPSILLGTSVLDTTGATTLTLANLAEGDHRIVAAYSGSPDFAPVALPSGDALPLTISAIGYLQDLSATTLTLATSHHGPMTVTLTSLGTFADTLSLSCANLPASASCTFASTPATLTAGAKIAVILTVDTDAIPGFARATPPALFPRTSPSIALAGLLSLGLFLGRRSTRRHRARLGLLSILFGAVTLSGCGAGTYPAHTAPGTYTIDILSKAARTGQSQDTQLTLIVTP